MAVYQFSALSDGQAISFSPTSDSLNFDQSAIAAADIRVTAVGVFLRRHCKPEIGGEHSRDNGCGPNLDFGHLRRG